MEEQQADGDRDEQLHRDLQLVQSTGFQAQMFLHGFFCPPDGVLPDAPKLKLYDVPRLTGSFPKPWQALTKEEREYRAYVPARGIVDLRQIVPFERGHCLDAKDIVKTVTAQRRSRDEANDRVRQEHSKFTEEALCQLGKFQYPDIRASVIYASGTENTVVQMRFDETATGPDLTQPNPMVVPIDNFSLRSAVFRPKIFIQILPRWCP